MCDLCEGQIQEESGIGWDQVERLIKRAFEDLKSAERNLPALILKFDKLRKRRNEFEYQGVFEMGREELKNSIEHAKQLVTAIRKSLEDSNPQKQFKW